MDNFLSPIKMEKSKKNIKFSLFSKKNFVKKLTLNNEKPLLFEDRLSKKNFEVFREEEEEEKKKVVKKKPKFSKKNKMLFREFLKRTLIRKGDKELLLIRCLRKEPEKRTKEDNNTIKNFLLSSKLVNYLLSIPFFLQKNCEKFMTTLSSEIRLKTLPEDRNLFKMGEKPDNLYIIYDGTVSIEKLESYTLSLTCKQYIKIIAERYQNLYKYKNDYMKIENNDNIIGFRKIISNDTVKSAQLYSKVIFEKIVENNQKIINLDKSEIHLLNLILLVIDIKNIFKDSKGNYLNLIFLIENYHYDPKKILFNMNYLSNNFSVNNIQFNMKQIYKNIPEINPELVEKYEKLVEINDYFSFTFFRKGKNIKLQDMGECFGDSTPYLNFYNVNDNDEEETKIRNYSATILEHSNLAYIEYDKFIELFKLEKEEIKYTETKFLKNTFFFRDINQYLFSKKYLKYFSYEESSYNNYLFKQGEKDKFIYFLKFGKYEIFCYKNINEICSMVDSISQKYISDQSKKNEFAKIINETYKIIKFCGFVKKEFNDDTPIKLLVLTQNYVLGIESLFNNLPYLYNAKILSERCGYYKIEYNHLLELMKEVKDGKEILLREKEYHLELILERLANITQKMAKYINNKLKINHINIKNNYYSYSMSKNQIKAKVTTNKIKEFLFDNNRKHKNSKFCFTSREEEYLKKNNKSKVKLYFLTEINNNNDNKLILKNKKFGLTHNKFYSKNIFKINKSNNYIHELNKNKNNYNNTIYQYNKIINNINKKKEIKTFSSFFNNNYISRNSKIEKVRNKYNSISANKISTKYNPIGIKREENLIKQIKETLDNELLFFNSISKNDLSQNMKAATIEPKSELRNKNDTITIIDNTNNNINNESEKNEKINIKKNFPKRFILPIYNSSKNVHKKSENFDIILPKSISGSKKRNSSRNMDKLSNNDLKTENSNFSKFTYSANGNKWIKNKIYDDDDNNNDNIIKININKNEDEKNLSSNSFYNKNKTFYNTHKGYKIFNGVDNSINKPKIESYSFKGKKYSTINTYNNKKFYRVMKQRVEDNLFMNGQTPIPKINYEH